MNDLSNEYNIVMSEIKNLTVAYNPNDFYYYKATFSDGTTKINTNNYYYDENTCSSYIYPNVDCRNGGNIDDVTKCYDKELCINRKNAMKINELQTNHDGADTRNVDINVDYNRELLKSYNLAIGSLGILAIFYFLYK
jgi:hypothetical protein